MDESLRSFLDGHDDAFWVATNRRLTQAALGYMAQFGFSGGNYADRAAEYAITAISKAFEACMRGASSRFDPERGDPMEPLEARFWKYLKLNCLRPLITRDAEKYTSRARWPIVSLDYLPEETRDVSPESEDAASLTLIELFDGADDELGKFISAAVEQLENNPERTSVNWAELERELQLTRYSRDQLRKRLATHLDRFRVPQPVL